MILTGVGRLGRDAELRYIPSGTAVCNLALAFNYGQKQEDGNRSSQWVECALWGRQAEALAQYLKKGNQVSVTAREPHIETFTRHDGTQGTKLVATVVDIELISGQRAADAPQTASTAPANKPADNFDAPFDDDIPF
jgi:single-strand DNA-binding protein